MRWQGRRESTEVEDRRGSRVGGRGLKLGGGAILLVIVISFLTGQNPLELLSTIDTGPPIPSEQVGPDGGAVPGGGPQADDAGRRFIAVVLASTEDTWDRVFTALGRRYEHPRLVLFSDAVQSACGYNSAAVGPFYCPGDSKVYLDLTFFNELSRRFGAPGDFAQAYVVAHEVGHHVQNVLGISDKVSQLQARARREEANELSVRLELQADCLAGVWGYYANQERGFLEPGDVEEGMRAAAAIGDDTLQRGAGRSVQPESWTHGSSEMRVRWLRRGLASGDVEQCDTLSGSRL